MKEQQKETSAKMVTLNKFAPKDSQTKTDGMYDPAFEHDNCGIGSVVNIKGIKTHATVENALKIVENLKHRAGKMQKERPVTVLVSFYRFLINFLRKP